MIDSVFTKTAQSVRDARLDVATLLWREGSPQSGVDHGDGTAPIVGSTLLNPLTRMQFEYRAIASPRRFFEDAHAGVALGLSDPSLSAPTFAIDHVWPTAWVPNFSTTGVSDAALAGAAYFDLPTDMTALFGVGHGS